MATIEELERRVAMLERRLGTVLTERVGGMPYHYRHPVTSEEITEVTAAG
jgi:hypothetical protein